MPPLVPLPIDEILPRLVSELQASPAVVLRAPPGAGKTTRVPPALWQAGFAAQGKIIVLQPRRVAARATAARMAAERGLTLGREIGYSVRFESRISRETVVEVATEGILLRMLATDPFLQGVSTIVFDEFHERSLSSDLALAMVRQVQQTVRPELKLVVMSATLAAQPIADYLGCGVLESLGRIYPVEIRRLATLDRTDPLDEAEAAIPELLRETAGHLLVFLPGVGEIRQLHERLSRANLPGDPAIFDLYGDLPAEQQDRVLTPTTRRKLILATNVAETSLTIDGVTAVIDTGLARTLRYDSNTGLDRLELGPISKASAEQRAGRAGRTQAGLCLQLWPDAAHRHRPEFDAPEIRRVDLAGAALQVLGWIEPDPAQFPWYEPPPPQTWRQGVELLSQLGAAKNGQITPLGREMAALPVHPRVARLLIEGRRRGVLREAALAAALLTEREPFSRPDGPPSRARRPSHVSRSDILDRVHLLDDSPHAPECNFFLGAIHDAGARQIHRARDQLVKLASRGYADVVEPGKMSADEALLRALVVAYPDRVARRREPQSRRGVMVGGRGVKLADESALGDEELYLCIVVDSGEQEALVRRASAVERAWLPEHLLVEENRVEFDDATGKVTSLKVVAWNGLVLEQSQGGPPGKEALAQALSSAARRTWPQAFPAEGGAAEFVARVRCLAQWMPDLNLPPITDEALQELLPEICLGRRSLAELRDAPWLERIKNRFDYDQLRRIDREAPERVDVPSGSKIAIQYTPGQPPILAVRIQEVFGLLETPRIAGGRIPLLMHLLGPNHRVAQVTGDLKSFWANTYALVRKDLRARYPKHSWPEDPYTAQAEHRPQRKR